MGFRTGLEGVPMGMVWGFVGNAMGFRRGFLRVSSELVREWFGNLPIFPLGLALYFMPKCYIFIQVLHFYTIYLAFIYLGRHIGYRVVGVSLKVGILKDTGNGYLCICSVLANFAMNFEKRKDMVSIQK